MRIATNIRALLRRLGFLLILVLAPAAQALVVLQYHHISEKTPHATSISPELFEQHMAYLKEKDFKVVSILEVKKWVQNGERVPDGTVAITFDDGYMSVYNNAYPVLKKHGFPFTVFVNSQAHDDQNKLFMSWKQLKKMTKHGATIGNHTDSHPHLIRQRSDESFSQFLIRREREIEFAEKRIEKEIGSAHKIFAYPYGEYDVRLQKHLAKEGYIAFGQQSGPIAVHSSPQALPRFPMGGNYGDMSDFQLKIWSLPFPESLIKVSGDDGKLIDQPELPADISKPVLRISSPMMRYIGQAECFASGQGRIDVDIKGGVLITKANRDLPPGRSRYNCTSNAGNGRYYWHSQLFIRRLPNGEWVPEV